MPRTLPSRALHRFLAVLLICGFSLPAAAQFSRDASASSKIDEAINTHYLMMELDKAEEMLKGVVEACEMKCSPGVKAKAWMYVGIVRGSGKNDLAGATDAFGTAKAYDPNVQLDQGLATPETKAAFDSKPGGSGEVVETSPSPAAPPPAAPVSNAGIPGDMTCTPDVTELLTRMPIPVSCTSALNPAGGVLKFKEYGATDWKKVDMRKVGEYLQAEIPCNVTSTAGPLEFYVGATDAAGEYIDQYGSKKQPATINLSDSAATPAPSFPGQAPVTRCASSEDCPPDFPGCSSANDSRQCGNADWGAACSNSSECKCGLSCDAGTCVQAQACSSDADCSGGDTCLGGYCSAGDGGAPAGPYKKHHFGFTFGADATFLGGNSLCTTERANSYNTYCLNADGTRFYGENAPFSVDVDPGPSMGQLRFKLSYDYAITDHMMVGAKVGLAFLNTPGPAADQGVDSFLPIHAEARFTYVFSSLGKTGFRPAVFLGGGLAEVSTAVPVPDQDILVHKRAGLVFLGGGGSLSYAMTENMAVGLDLGFQMLFAYYVPSVAVHPALSFSYGL